MNFILWKTVGIYILNKINYTDLINKDNNVIMITEFDNIYISVKMYSIFFC